MGEKPSESLEEVENLTKKGHQFLQDGDIENSYLTYEKALNLAQATKDAFTIRACLFNTGACCVARGEPQMGLEYLLRAVPPEKHTDGLLNFCDLNYNLAITYDLLNQPNQAKRCYETALEGYRDCSNTDMIAEVCLKLGGTLATLGSLEEAVGVFHESEKAFGQLQDHRHEMLCLSSRATLLAEMRNEQCKSLLNIVVNGSEHFENDALKAKIYSDIGLVYTSLGHYHSAVQYLEKSVSVLQSTGEKDQKLEASVYQNLGAVHNQLGAYVKAVTYHERAIELYGVLSMRYAQGHAFGNLGFAYGQIGELEKSQEYFTHAIQASKDCKDYHGQWQAYEGLSAVHFQRKDYQKAVACLRTALTILPLGGADNNHINERIVAKLSCALENQLSEDKQLKIQPETKRHLGRSKKSRLVQVQVEAPEGTDGSVLDNCDHPFPVVDASNIRESSPKVGNVRHREKNHKFIARGLHVDEPSSGIEDVNASESTFDTITSYSGNASSSAPKDPSDAGSMHPSESQLQGTTLKCSKKNPLNNTYEEPQDIVHAIESGNLHLHDLPPGPRDTVLACIADSAESKELPSNRTRQGNRTKKSTVCSIQ